jgi:phosphatidylserine/phosphatidylglycerophosphate/cardiolipin synthase-like enzyme
MNFDNRSMALNDESALMVLDTAIGSQMNDIFIRDLQHAEEMSIATFRQRSWFERLLERSVNLITRLL